MNTKALKDRSPDIYHASAKTAEIVDVPTIRFLAVDGRGAPENSVAFEEAIEALYGVSYTLKFGIKQQLGVEYHVGPLEGLWWQEAAGPFDEAAWTEHPERWLWTLMVAQPDFISPEQVAEAIETLRRKRDAEGCNRLRVEDFHEGLSAQIMHIGPYSAELPTIQRLHAFIRELGYEPRGRHHEIYLGDPRRAKPERLRTILRHPIRRGI